MFTPVVLQMMLVGEESGCARRHDGRGRRHVQARGRVRAEDAGAQIEPILIVCLGVLVLILALGVFLPIWDLGRAAFGRAEARWLSARGVHRRCSFRAMRAVAARLQPAGAARVSIALIAVFAGVLLERLLFYQEAAEKARMELEATKLKLALQVHIGDLIARNQPAGLRGDCAREPDALAGRSRWPDTGANSGRSEAELPQGESGTSTARARSWCTCRNLDRNLQPGRHRPHARALARAAGACPRRGARRTSTVIGLQLVPVSAYRWF